jgi:sugar phosphate isomerase/epimerase
VTEIVHPLPEKGRALLEKVQVNIPFPMLLENLEGILQIGLQPEIYFSSKTLDRLSGKDVERVSQKLRQKNISVTFHAPFMDLSPGAVDDKIREVTAFRFSQVMDLVPYFHPRAIVFHPGYDRWRFDSDVALWLEGSLLTWKPLAERAEILSVRLALENVFEENPSILWRLLEAIPSPSLGYCLDTGHGHLFSKVPIVQWIEVLGPRLVEVHLHDNHSQADEHLPVGYGEINFADIFSSLRGKNLQPIYTIEPHLREHLEPSLRALEKYL